MKEARGIQIKALSASVIGGALEFYVFGLFGFIAPLISPLFFPTEDRVLSVFLGFSTYAIGFLMRPIGGIIFGHIGDRMGRRVALYSSLLLMGITTLFMGLLPTYATIGIAAPILMVLARLLQGLSAGGELPGGLIFAIEHTSPRRTGFIGSLIETGYGAGAALGSLAGLVSTFPNMPSWLWRLSFVFGFLISLIGLYVRAYTTETPAFEAMQEKEKEPFPLLLGLKTMAFPMFFAICMSAFAGIIIFINGVFLPFFFGQYASVSESSVRFSSTVSQVVFMFLLPLFGYLSDIKGRKPLLQIGSLSASLLLASIFFMAQKLTACVKGI